MKILFSVILFAISLLGLNAQQLSWDLNEDSAGVSTAEALQTGIFVAGDGLTSFTIGTTGAYAKSWTTSSDIDLNDYFQVSFIVDSQHTYTITKLSYSERRSNSGIANYEIRYATDSSFSTYTVLTNIAVPDNDLERDTSLDLHLLLEAGDTAYIRWYGYNSESSSGTWRINDKSLKINGNLAAVNLHNHDAKAVSYETVKTNTISSYNRTASRTKELMQFYIVDEGEDDALPTNIRQLYFSNSILSNSLDWKKSLAGIVFSSDGNTLETDSLIITDSDVTAYFKNDFVVDDKDSVLLKVAVYINPVGLTEGDKLQFKIDKSNHSFVADTSGTAFKNTFAKDILSDTLIVDIKAEQLQFVTQDFLQKTNKDFEIALQSVDNYGNIDNDANYELSLSLDKNTTALSAASGLTKSLVNGKLSWTDLRISKAEEYILSAKNSTADIQVQSQSFKITENGYNLFDDFSDGNTTANPIWYGDATKLNVDAAKHLQLFTETDLGDTAILVAPFYYLQDSLEWRTRISLDFSPSKNNFVRYYLMASQVDLTKADTAVYIQMGENGSEDAFSLYFKKTEDVQLVAKGELGKIASAFDKELKIIYRENTQSWKVFSKDTKDFVWEEEFSTTKAIPMQNPVLFTGIYCRYTSGNAEGKMFFDDFYAGAVIIDSIAPQLTIAQVVEDKLIRLDFDESLNASSIQLDDFKLDGVAPIRVDKDSALQAFVKLYFAASFPADTPMELSYQSISDLEENSISEIHTVKLYYHPIKALDIIIDEMMIDPTPTVYLPEAEYIELYNTQAVPISLKDWQLQINTTNYTLPDTIIQPKEYFLLVAKDKAALFSDFKTIPIFDEGKLTNTSASVLLLSPKGEWIHKVNYNKDWYRNSDKDEGGWSLEMIDKSYPCEEEMNWKASCSAKGGTPAAINCVDSVFVPELLKIKRAYFLDDSLIVLSWNKMLNPDYQPDNNLFLIDDKSATAVYYEKGTNEIKLYFSQEFERNKIYYLTIKDAIADCKGDLWESVKIPLGLPLAVDSNDIVINEVLFHPQTSHHKYIELVNISDKILDLSEMRLATLKNEELYSIKEISSIPLIVFPGEYLVLSDDIKDIKRSYPTSYPDKLYIIPQFPSISTKEGDVLLLNKGFAVIDKMHYDEDYHNPILIDVLGVALEKLNPKANGLLSSSWYSAAENAGFGTPTDTNSQYRVTDNQSIADWIRLSPENFSPDLDGYNDLLYIYYELPENEYIANLNIYDSKGYKLYTLAQNDLLGTKGYWTWDGRDDDRHILPMGIYIIVIDLWHQNGATRQIKKVVTLSKKL